MLASLLGRLGSLQMHIIWRIPSYCKLTLLRYMPEIIPLAISVKTVSSGMDLV